MNPQLTPRALDVIADSGETGELPLRNAAPGSSGGGSAERELDLYDEIECDLPYLFGRAAAEGHEGAQRLACQVREKMQRARQGEKR